MSLQKPHQVLWRWFFGVGSNKKAMNGTKTNMAPSIYKIFKTPNLWPFKITPSRKWIQKSYQDLTTSSVFNFWMASRLVVQDTSCKQMMSASSCSKMAKSASAPEQKWGKTVDGNFPKDIFNHLVEQRSTKPLWMTWAIEILIGVYAPESWHFMTFWNIPGI